MYATVMEITKCSNVFSRLFSGSWGFLKYTRQSRKGLGNYKKYIYIYIYIYKTL